MSRRSIHEKTMLSDSLTCLALDAVNGGLRSSKAVAEALDTNTKLAHAYLRINMVRGNVKRTPYAYGGATRIKWTITPRGRRKLNEARG